MDNKIETNLISAAKEGMRNAFTGTNDPNCFRIGAAVLTKKGNIYSSGQYFSDTYSLTVHAEQAALIHAAAHGEYEIVAIAIIGNDAASGNEQVYPCHMCKQLLWESYLRSGIDTEIVLLKSDGAVLERLSLLSIINYPWPRKL